MTTITQPVHDCVDGQQRVGLRIRARLTLHELTVAAVYAFDVYGAEEPTLTTQFREAVGQCLVEHGREELMHRYIDDGFDTGLHCAYERLHRLVAKAFGFPPPTDNETETP